MCGEFTDFFIIKQMKKPYLEKTADIWRSYQCFPHQMTFEKRAQKFHTDDASLPRSCLPRKCITFVFNFSWVIQSSKEKLRTMLMQNFGRETRCIMGDVNMANISPVHCWPTTPNVVGCNMLLPFVHPVACSCTKFETSLRICTNRRTNPQYRWPNSAVKTS